WIGIPFSAMYIIALMENSLLFIIIKSEPCLHEPMHTFLFMLGATDTALSTSIVPEMLRIFWFHFQEVNLDACIAQTYFLHGLSLTQSGVLLDMAFDHFTAICNPLGCTSVLTNTKIIKIRLEILIKSFMLIIRSFIFIAPIIHLKCFRSCHSYIIFHSFCLHQDLLRLSCSNIRFNSFYALALVICTLLFDSILILESYILILHVLAILSPEEWFKSLQTCVSHICAVLFFYIPIISLTVVHHFGKHLSSVVHVLMGNICILFPSLMNFKIYSKTQQMRTRIQKWFSMKR
uniref:G-protein coupled receptors family 1 profile domain-containing protein n=1 Tax=Bos taurus TaxID=9913 RepID=A0AAA9T9L6_BOVIN